jgi:hypothetical protein
MKRLQQLCVAGVFTLVLTTATFAGHIDTGGKTEPPPPPPASATTSGEIPIDSKDDAGDEFHFIEDIAVDLLHMMLSVF